MKTHINPKKETWDAIMKRPNIRQEQLTDAVQSILRDVRQNGNDAVAKYTRLFDNLTLEHFAVSEKEIEAGCRLVDSDLKQAIEIAYNNIESFHKSQLFPEDQVETMPGITCWRKQVAIERVGLYIPGGNAPLFSTILMLGIPAKLAGCEEIVMCTPCRKDGTVDPAILYTAQRVGIKNIQKVGGAQAIAAMAYGTETIDPVFKIFGPGNQYVTMAKTLVQQDGVAIDMPAGPSELLIIADSSCNPKYVAADLLSQAEHGTDSQLVLLCNNAETLETCLTEVSRQLSLLPQQEIASKALFNSHAVVFESIETCIGFSNAYAPEHLIIATSNASAICENIKNAGSVFLGNFSCESAGDYASGTNHTLPTNGYARNHSGISIDSFVKQISFQKITAEGIKNVGPAIELMSEAEGLIAHKNAVSLRLNDLT